MAILIIMESHHMHGIGELTSHLSPSRRIKKERAACSVAVVPLANRECAVQIPHSALQCSAVQFAAHTLAFRLASQFDTVLHQLLKLRTRVIRC